MKMKKNNKIKCYLDTLPCDIIELDISNQKIKQLPNLSRFKQLRILNCSHNQIKCFTHLPEKLYELYCERNELTSLPNDLPTKLQVLNCSGNRLTITLFFNLFELLSK
jgi:Leucine-rich repeat (LRR) protein